MSVHLHVYLNIDRLPDALAWQTAVRAAGYDLVFDEFSTREQTGFLPVTLNGVQCGFEYSLSKDVPDSEELLSIVGSRKFLAEFTWQSSELDLQAAQIAAAVLAHLSDGVLVDPQSGQWTPANKVLEQLEKDLAEMRNWRREQAERKWARETSRRCPSCGAPCPEYRKHCWVCGLELGRADR